LACSDSRVSPDLVFDQSLGDLFVIRTAGNVADPVGLGSIEYAVDHLHSTVRLCSTPEVWRCGRRVFGERCLAATWKRSVTRSVPPSPKPKTYAKPDDLLEAAVKENVHQSAKDVLANSEILPTQLKPAS